MRAKGKAAADALRRAVKELEEDHLVPRLWQAAERQAVSSANSDDAATAKQAKQAKVDPLENWDTVVQELGLESWVERHAASGGVAVFTKLLSYPLTLAKYAHAHCDLEKSNNDNIRVSIVGARAESSLPALYWTHLVALAPDSARAQQWNLQFIGPDVSLSGPPVHDALRDREVSILNQVSFATAQRPLETCELPSPDLYAFFNSGIGHPKESKRWAQALADLKGSGRRALFTSFHADDLARDLKALEALGANINFVERENPLRSLSRESSPDPSERVFANAAVVVATL
ncbi:Zinc finger MYND domain-containing protein 15 [Hondaea fermentalgiana]|uniref:Zinc finger MYND domain-containing protein 15 n=1 Tax=Hondaea fermentalgiana TaxID=2315210 RepID=A0A2R5GRJ2_9STRA|nr:Zinc finger MYND domain-containing protein 15 [Hondaea fermentalgiana]|eukprot:GBG33506.1 Zinc finger MYND domain-containing protein 15 [Hondaea fermentalgiana]